MQHSTQCSDLVAAWEGLPDGDKSTVNFDPYMDPVGIWTIGYGRALRGADGKYLRGPARRAEAAAQYPGGITRATAKTMLDKDLGKLDPEITSLAGSATTQSQFDALLSFQFNTGALSGSSLRRLHKAGKGAGPALTDAQVKALAKRLRDRTLGTPTSVLEGFAAFSFASKTFFGGLYCRRLAEWRLYAGDDAATASAFGAKVRSLIAQ